MTPRAVAFICAVIWSRMACSVAWMAELFTRPSEPIALGGLKTAGWESIARVPFVQTAPSGQTGSEPSAQVALSPRKHCGALGVARQSIVRWPTVTVVLQEAATGIEPLVKRQICVGRHGDAQNRPSCQKPPPQVPPAGAGRGTG